MRVRIAAKKCSTGSLTLTVSKIHTKHTLRIHVCADFPDLFLVMFNLSDCIPPVVFVRYILIQHRLCSAGIAARGSWDIQSNII